MDVDTKLNEIAVGQNQSKRGDDLTQIKREAKDGLDYEVIEYGNPLKNYWGYQVIFYETRADGLYKKSQGYGFEEKERTFDWTKQERPI